MLEYAKISILRPNDVIKSTKASKFEMIILIIIIIDILIYHTKIDDYYSLKYLITKCEGAYVYKIGQIHG